MKNTVWRGIGHTLILMLTLFLFSVSFMQLTFMLLQADAPAALLQSGGDGADAPAEISGSAPAEPEPETEAETEPEPDGEDYPTLRQRITRLIVDSPRIAGLFYAGLFLMIALMLILDQSPLRQCGQRTRVRILVNAALYLGCGVPFLAEGYTSRAITVMNILYTAILFGESAFKLKQDHRPRHVSGRTVLLILAAVNLYLFPIMPLFVLIVIALRAFRQILRISFAQIRMDVLRRIIRKTYASEILLGMVLLMVAFSLVLSLLDPGIPSFEDALWFCFATVTTVGYGDVTATTTLGRILSVILGIYGIVVVALITSIIVNFYNEMKSE